MDIAELSFLDRYIADSSEALSAFSKEPHRKIIFSIASTITSALKAGNKVLTAGNGGSAGDAQHIAGEFLSRLFFDRAPLAAIALSTDSSVITAVGNDYGFDRIFERQIRGIGREGDVFVAISTSGNSKNILTALRSAKEMGLTTVGLTGAAVSPMLELCDVALRAPSVNTAIVQQIHITAAHLICGLVELDMFEAAPENKSAAP